MAPPAGESSNRWVLLRVVAGTVSASQMVPRSELAAMKVIPQPSAPNKKKEEPIITDHKAIVDKIAERNLQETNADLWHCIRGNYHNEAVIKIKSHEHNLARAGKSDPRNF